MVAKKVSFIIKRCRGFNGREGMCMGGDRGGTPAHMKKVKRI